MPRSYEEQYQQRKKYLSEAVEDGTVDSADAEAIRELCNAFDENKPTTPLPQWPDAPSHIVDYKEYGTLSAWMYCLTCYAKEITLLDTTTDEINQLAEEWLEGTADVKDDGLQKGSIRQYQNSIRMFYRYFDVDGVEQDRIQVFEREETSVDERDMLTESEIQRVRKAPDHPRDKCIVDLLLYTGLRNSGLRSLRIKDVDPIEGVWQFNTGSDDLKGVYKPRAERPLLGAANAVRDWLDYHPSDDPDAYLIVGKPKYGKARPYSKVTHRTIGRVMQSVKEEADIEKPLHPHAMRHNFVTICKREYGLEDSTVKFLIGHAPDSTIMETTYSHLTGEDHRRKAEVAAGVRDEEDESPLAPDFCDDCGEPLPSNARLCHRCGREYTPDAREASETIEDAFYETKGQVDGEKEDALDRFRDFLEDNPDIRDELFRDLERS